MERPTRILLAFSSLRVAEALYGRVEDCVHFCRNGDVNAATVRLILPVPLCCRFCPGKPVETRSDIETAVTYQEVRVRLSHVCEEQLRVPIDKVPECRGRLQHLPGWARPMTMTDEHEHTTPTRRVDSAQYLLRNDRVPRQSGDDQDAMSNNATYSVVST
jgi:hypothetical protein